MICDILQNNEIFERPFQLRRMKEVTIMNNPTRDTIDPMWQDYDEETDTITDNKTGKKYTGDGELIDTYFGE